MTRHPLTTLPKARISSESSQRSPSDAAVDGFRRTRELVKGTGRGCDCDVLLANQLVEPLDRSRVRSPQGFFNPNAAQGLAVGQSKVGAPGCEG